MISLVLKVLIFRTIGEDIGEKLGCGAHLQALHRVSAAGYNSADMMTLDMFEEIAMQGESALDEYLLPMDTAVIHLNRVELTPLETQDISYGRVLSKLTSYKSGDLVRMYAESDSRF